MAETDLYLPVKTFLEGQGYVVKGEVRECDIVALRGEEPPLIVELKTKFSIPLLLQGVDRQAVTDAVYLAITPPQRRQTSDIVKLCRRLGLGLIIVTGRNVEAVVDPLPYQPRRNTRRKALLLKEFSHRVGDPNLGGSARKPRMTAYRQDALRCLAHIAGAEGAVAKVSVIRSATAVARTANILQDDVYGWFQRQARGIYGLSPKGVEALATYSVTLAAIQAAETGGEAMAGSPTMA